MDRMMIARRVNEGEGDRGRVNEGGGDGRGQRQGLGELKREEKGEGGSCRVVGKENGMGGEN